MTVVLSKDARVLLGERVRTSRLLGKDEELVLHGGGNTSVKLTVRDTLQRNREALLVKGSGSDLASIDENGFTILDMVPLLEAKAIERMSDIEMTSYLRTCMLDPDQPFPSVETFLHAFIKAKFVDHSHADSILSLTNTDLDDGKIAEIFGGKVLVLPYVAPGFELARYFMDFVSSIDISGYEGVILRHHGLVTWGETADESYDRHINIVSAAKNFIAEKWKGIQRREIEEGKRDEFIDFLPVLRGLLSRGNRKILYWDNSPEMVGYSLLPEAEEFSSLGPATPDMLIRTKMNYLYLRSLSEAREGVEKYVADYRDKFQRYIGTSYPMHDPYPSVIVVKGYGVVTSSPSYKESRIIGDQVRHSFRVSIAAKSVGRNRFITEKQAFEMEYWSLEEAKLKKFRKPELQGYIGLVTGAASGIGKVTFSRFADEGILAIGADIDPSIVFMTDKNGMKFGMKFDITNEEEVRNAFREVVGMFGGIDVVFNNAGYLKPSPLDELSLNELRKHIEVNSIGSFNVTKEAFKIMKKQGIGGNIIFNITKNVTNPGKGMTAYGTSKAFASQLSRYVAVEGGSYGIRSNVVNPDKIFRESKIWEGGVLEDRAKAKGITVDEYRKGNLLHMEVLPEHVANVVIALIRDGTFGATTGASIPVDGGIQ